ncbi:MAG: hypothetical protein IJA48_07600 [Oscillospiraceae bacterium]|nr:hypothetical protein [Oscillospiraceae bacterium]
MKKEYQRPILIKEQFCVEDWIAACAVENKNPSLSESCSYTPPNVGLPIFAGDWTSCLVSEDDYETSVGSDIFCLHAGVSNVFGS